MLYECPRINASDIANRLFALIRAPNTNSTTGTAQRRILMMPKVKKVHLGVASVTNCKMTSGRAPPTTRRPLAAAVREESVPAGE